MIKIFCDKCGVEIDDNAQGDLLNIAIHIWYNEHDEEWPIAQLCQQCWKSFEHIVQFIMETELDMARIIDRVSGTELASLRDIDLRGKSDIAGLADKAQVREAKAEEEIQIEINLDEKGVPSIFDWRELDE